MSIKRYAAALGAAGLVFAGVYGAAAALDVQGGTLQSGQSGSLACDPDGVKVGFATENDDQTVRTVKVTEIADACNGSNLLATVLNKAGTAVGQGEAVIGNGAATVRLSGAVPIRDADKIQVTIES